MITKITLQPDTIKKLRNQRYDENPKGVKGFEGYTLDADTDNGDFDSEKGAMTDYKLTLVSPDGQVYIGRGGYYTGVTGECYNYEVEFTPKKPRIKKNKAEKDKQEYELYLKLKKKYDKDVKY